ncbi:Outer membrane efflux protein [compost metagenome]
MKQIIFSVLLCWCSASFSQELLTLQVCLDMAERNSLQIAAESALLKSSQVENQFHWWSLLPDLSGTTGLNTSFGRRLDPFTNTFATSSVNSQSFGLNSNVQLFNGFAYFHKRNKFAGRIQLDELQLSAKRNELYIRVIEEFIALAKLSVQVRLSEARIEIYEQIQNIQKLLLKEGRTHAIDTLKSHQSLLTEQGLLLKLSHESNLKNIQLNFLVGLPLRTEHLPDITSISSIIEKPRFTGAYQAEALEMEEILLDYQLKTDRAEFLPVISLNGLVGTGFSTNNKDYLSPGNPTKPYRSQIRENLYEGIGFYLSVPVFNRGEWLKTKQLHAIRKTELTEKRELAEKTLEKQKLEQEQKQLNAKAALELNKRLTANLEMIRTKSLLLYETGRLTYTELETVLLDWQQKQVETELLKLDYELLQLIE